MHVGIMIFYEDAVKTRKTFTAVYTRDYYSYIYTSVR